MKDLTNAQDLLNEFELLLTAMKEEDVCKDIIEAVMIIKEKAVDVIDELDKCKEDKKEDKI